MIKTHNSMDLINQLLKPLQRSLDEVMKIMDRDIDLERIAVIEEELEKNSNSQYPLNTDSIQDKRNHLKFKSNKKNQQSPDMRIHEDYSNGIQSHIEKTNEFISEIPSSKPLTKLANINVKKNEYSKEKYKSENLKNIQPISSQIDISNMKILDRNSYSGRYHGVILKKETNIDFQNFSTLRNYSSESNFRNYSKDITGNEQRKTTEPVEELVPITGNQARKVSESPLINFNPSLDPSSNMKLTGPKEKNNQDISLDNINSHQFDSAMGIPFKELDSDELKKLQIKSGSDFKMPHASNEQNRSSQDGRDFEEISSNTDKKTNIDRNVSVPIKTTSNLKMPHVSNEQNRSSLDEERIKERPINTLKNKDVNKNIPIQMKTNSNIFENPAQVNPENSSTNAHLYQPNGKIPLTREVKQLSDRIVKAVNPVLEQAQSATFKSVQNRDVSFEHSSGEKAPENQDEKPESNSIKNTFNVNVSMSADSSTAVSRNEMLEDALIEVLLSSARRQGLEI